MYPESRSQTFVDGGEDKTRIGKIIRVYRGGREGRQGGKKRGEPKEERWGEKEEEISHS